MTRGMALVVGVGVIAAAVGFGFGRAGTGSLRSEINRQRDEIETLRSDLADEAEAALEEEAHAIITLARDIDRFYHASVRATGVAWGRGFRAACTHLGSTDDACEVAYSTAAGFCIEFPGEEPLCLEPLPGYFHVHDPIKERLARQIRRWVVEPLRALHCVANESASSPLEAACRSLRGVPEN